jgi:phenylacetate-CoA ligase
MSANLLPRTEDPPVFADLRDQIQADIFSNLPERLGRLRWDADRLRMLQRDRLRALLAHVKQRSAFHAGRLRGVDPDRYELTDLARLPVMTKADMMANFDQVVTDDRVSRAAAERALEATSTEPVPMPGGFLCMATGGSSGQRGIFTYDVAGTAEFVTMIFRTRIAALAAMASADAAPGGAHTGPPGDAQDQPPGDAQDQPPGDAQAGPPAPLQIPKTTIAMVGAPSAVHGTMFVPSIMAGSPISFVHVPVTLPVQEIVSRLNRLRPDAVFGYPSMLARLAAEQQARHLAIAPKFVNCTAETLLPAFRMAIRTAFGAPIMNTFATSEGLIGSSGLNEEFITLGTDGCIVEPVDDCYQPVPPGTPSAKVLVTNLYNYLQPLIRYELADSFTRQPDSSGHGHLRVTVDGRSDAILRYPGAEVHPLGLRSVLLGAPEVLDYQATQTVHGLSVNVLLERPADLRALEARLESALERAGLAGPHVEVQEVTSLPRHPETGKLRRVLPAWIDESSRR